MFQYLELCQSYVLRAGNTYTKEQMINRAKIKIIDNGKYCTELKEYDDKFDGPIIKNWQTFRQF